MVYEIEKIGDDRYIFHIDEVEFTVCSDDFDFNTGAIIRPRYSRHVDSANKYYAIFYDFNTSKMYWDWSFNVFPGNESIILAKSKHDNGEAIVKMEDGYWTVYSNETQKDRDSLGKIIKDNIDNILETIKAIQAETLLD